MGNICVGRGRAGGEKAGVLWRSCIRVKTLWLGCLDVNERKGLKRKARQELGLTGKVKKGNVGEVTVDVLGLTRHL